ncbi:MAG: hypothetical protein IMW98_01165 [Firmicutes bacterium]|nr:hypothetical protein [Bacillota bacterium]
MDGWPLLARWLAVAAVAVAVRLVDDLLDAPLDAGARTPNWTARLGAGAAAYALAALAAAAALDARAASACALAAYAAGMLREPRGRMPSGLRAWQETALAGALCLWAGGPALGTAALLSLLSVDLADDLADDPSPAVSYLGARWPRAAAWGFSAALAAAALGVEASLAAAVLAFGGGAVALRALAARRGRGKDG